MCGRQFLIVENGRDFGCFGGERCWTAQSATETRDALRHARRSCVGSEGGQIEAKWTFRSAGITSRGPESGICSHLCLTSDSESPRKRVIHRQTRSESQDSGKGQISRVGTRECSISNSDTYSTSSNPCSYCQLPEYRILRAIWDWALKCAMTKTKGGVMSVCKDHSSAKAFHVLTL